MVDGEAEIFCEQVARDVLLHAFDDAQNAFVGVDEGIVVTGI